jgi:hypothetical protein
MWTDASSTEPGQSALRQLGMRTVGTLLVLTFLGACGHASNMSTATGPSITAAESVPATLAPTTSLPPPPGDAAPGTTAAVMPVRNDALVASATPTHVTEPCPQSLGGPEGGNAMDTELGKLEPMLGIVLAYGTQHHDEFGGYGLIWRGTNDASVFISFTQHLDVHRDALEQLVAHPDELIVCQVAVPEDVGRALAAKLTDDLAGRFSFVGWGMNGVEVVLNPGEEVLADELVAEYGDAVLVTVCSNPAGCAATAS